MKRIWTYKETRALVTALEDRFTAFAQKNGLEMYYEKLIHDKDKGTILMTNITFYIKGGSTAQNFFEKEDARWVRENVEAIVNSSKEEHSIFSFEIKNGSYYHDSCILGKLSLTYKVEGTLEDQYAYLNNEVLGEALKVTDVSITPSDRMLVRETKPVGKTYFYAGKFFTITNIDLENSKYPFIYIDDKGVKYKTSLGYLAIVIRRGTEVQQGGLQCQH